MLYPYNKPYLLNVILHPKWNGNPRAEMVELVDTRDLKSLGYLWLWEFKSLSRHNKTIENIGGFFITLIPYLISQILPHLVMFTPIRDTEIRDTVSFNKKNN